MPKRKRIRKFPSDKIQGKGSWVLVAQLTVGEMREIRKRAKVAEKDPEVDMFEATVQTLKTHIKEWNWVDDDGEPMPQPKDDPSVIDKLAELEIVFLSECVRGSEDKAKN